MKKILKQLVVVMLIIGSGLGAFYFAQTSFEKINEMRQLERVPPTSINSSVTGVVSVEGVVQAADLLLNSELTHTPSVYYRYLVEEEETDSDGNTSWTTRADRSDSVAFRLYDGQSTAEVAVTEDDERPIDWRLHHAIQETKGRFRYTEWRIVPGENVFIFGFFDDVANKPVIRFDRDGDFIPIVSTLGEFEARSAKGGGSILWLILAIGCLSVSVYGCIWTFRVHRVLVYLTLFSISVFLLLFQFGLTMMKQDVDIAFRYYDQQILGAEQKLKSRSQQLGVAHHLLETSHSILSIDSWPPASTSASDAQLQTLVLLRDDLREHLLKTFKRLELQYSKLPYPQFLWATGRQVKLLPFNPTREELNVVAQTNSDFPISRLTGWWTVALPALFSVLFALFCWLGLAAVKTKRMIENIPTSPCKGVVYGITEVIGTVDAGDSPQFVSPLTRQKAVWCHYIVEEKRGSGKNAKWVTLSNDKTEVPFSCADSTGAIPVLSTKAEVITHRTKIKQDGNRRFTEHLLCHGDHLYCLGTAQVSADGERLVLGHVVDSPLIISNKTEFEIMLAKARTGIALWSGAMIFALSAVIILLGAEGGLAPTDFLMAALGAPFVLLGLMLLLHYNDLIFLRQRVERNYANILVSLTKRKDLIPALTEVTQTYVEFEASLQTAMAELRNNVSRFSEKQASLDSDEQALNVRNYIQDESQLVHRIRAVVENYPKLKADDVFQQLFRSLVALENDVSFMRAGFNDAVETYNARCETFPDSILAGLFSFKLKKYTQGL
jgi:hypothetical protein